MSNIVMHYKTLPSVAAWIYLSNSQTVQLSKCSWYDQNEELQQIYFIPLDWSPVYWTGPLFSGLFPYLLEWSPIYWTGPLFIELVQYLLD